MERAVSKGEMWIMGADWGQYNSSLCFKCLLDHMILSDWFLCDWICQSMSCSHILNNFNVHFLPQLDGYCIGFTVLCIF